MARILKGYLAGSYFNTTLAQSRIDLANQLRQLSNDHIQVQVYNPVEQTINNQDRYQTSCTQLYHDNNQALDSADFVILDLSDHQSDVLGQLGRISIIIDKINPNLKLYVLWKLNLGSDDFYFGVNRYVRGAVEKYSKYYRSEQEILAEIQKDFNF